MSHLENGNGDSVPAKIRAMHFKEKIVNEVLNGQRSKLRQTIRRLFLDREMDAVQIMEYIDEKGLLPDWEKNVSTVTRVGIIRELVRYLIHPDDRAELARKRYAKATERRQESLGEKRNEWMEKNGMYVWPQEHRDYFAELLKNPHMKSGSRYNHRKLSMAMNERFRTDAYTPARTNDYLLRTKHASRYVERTRQKRAKRREQALNGNGHANGNGNGLLEAPPYEDKPDQTAGDALQCDQQDFVA